MKRGKKIGFIIVLVSVLFSLTSCLQLLVNIEVSRRVYIDTKNYEVFRKESNLSLKDGEYARATFSLDPRCEPVLKLYPSGRIAVSWQYVQPRLPSYEAAYQFTTEEVAHWLEKNGMDPSCALAEAKWLMRVQHGIIVIRQGNAVHAIFR